MAIKTSIVILNYNTKEITENCVKSVIKNTKKIDYEIILIDNGSTDGSQSVLGKLAAKNSRIKFIKNKKNLGFAKGNNVGIKKAKGEYVLLLNSDTIVNSNAIGKMSSWMDRHISVGVSTCKLLNEDGTIQGTGGYFPNLLRVFSWMSVEDIPGVEKLVKPFHPHRGKSFYKNSSFYKKQHEVDWVTGAFMFVRKQVFEEVGRIDEDYFMYTEDTDFCFRAKQAGWKIVYLPKWSIIHLGGKSSNSEFPIVSEFKSVKVFYQKHYPKWQLPLLTAFLKMGALLRMVVFAILMRKEGVKTYAKAFSAV
jgi:hypothetical protein